MSENLGPQMSWSEDGLLVSRVERGKALMTARQKAKKLLHSVQSTRFLPGAGGWDVRTIYASREAVVPEYPVQWDAYRKEAVIALGEDAVLVPDPEKVLLAGDLHGDEIEALTAVFLAQALGCQAVMQLGDFGAFTDKAGQRFLDLVATAVERTGVPVFFIDGNHDDFDLLARWPVLASGWRPLRLGVTHVPRGQRWQWLGVAWGGLGGAFSINRATSTKGRDWWDEELITGADLDRLGDEPLEVLLTHDAPSAYRHPRSKPADYRTPEQIEQAKASRAVIEQAEFHRTSINTALVRTGAPLIFHGHFHRVHRTEFFWPDANGIDMPRTAYGLDKNGSGQAAYLTIERAS